MIFPFFQIQASEDVCALPVSERSETDTCLGRGIALREGANQCQYHDWLALQSSKKGQPERRLSYIG